LKNASFTQKIINEMKKNKNLIKMKNQIKNYALMKINWSCKSFGGYA